jgi:signal peptide peptidase SppA
MPGKPPLERYEHLVAFALDQPWAVTRPMLAIVADILSRRMAGQDARAEDLEHAAQLAQTRHETRASAAAGTGLAVLSLHGVIAPRMNLFSDISGGATFEALQNEFADALANPQVGTIVLDIDSPGGSASGATEFAKAVREGRTTKPVIAVAQYAMNSAAYWVGSNATEVVAAPSAQVGSVGVYMIHNDLSAALDQLGVKRTYIAAGKYKVDPNETEPLTDESKARLQSLVDQTYTAFVKDVALGRGVSQAAVRNGFGQGAIVLADEALSLGMVDRIDTLAHTLARLTTPAPTTVARGQAQTSSTTRDTAQEPGEATAQDRAADRRLRQEWERAFRERAFARS